MNTTTYKKSVPSPFQTMQKKAFDVQDNKHPAREYILKNMGVYSLTATFEEDMQTLATFRHIPGLIAFICTLKRDNEVIGQGRGTAVLSRVNRFIDRTVRIAFNSALIDAVVRSTKALDVLQLDTENKDGITPIQSTDVPASEKQKSYLLQLIDDNVTDDDERSQWEKKIKTISKDDASTAIQSFKNQ